MQDHRTQDAVYCTYTHRGELPPALKRLLRDLDSLIRDIASSACTELVIVSPYMSASGLAVIKSSMAASVQRGCWIRLVTADINSPSSPNRLALKHLVEGSEGRIIRTKLRVLTHSGQPPTLVHAKAVIADRTRGYIGSANLSVSALERNIEVGVELSARQSDVLATLIEYLESDGKLQDCTAEILGDV